MSVLREVKYLKARQAEAIPDMADDIYSKRELLWQYVANLELTTSWYNKVMSKVLEVEMPLIQSQLTDIDAKLKEAEDSLCWTSQGRATERTLVHLLRSSTDVSVMQSS